MIALLSTTTNLTHILVPTDVSIFIYSITFLVSSRAKNDTLSLEYILDFGISCHILFTNTFILYCIPFCVFVILILFGKTLQSHTLYVRVRAHTILFIIRVFVWTVDTGHSHIFITNLECSALLDQYQRFFFNFSKKVSL